MRHDINLEDLPVTTRMSLSDFVSSFLFGFVCCLGLCMFLAASGCATAAPTERGVPSVLLAAGVPDVPLVSDERLSDLEIDGFGAGIKPNAVTVLSGVDEAPRAPLYTYERKLVVNKRPQPRPTLAGMLDEDVLDGAFYRGRKVPQSAVAKTAPTPPPAE